MSEVFEVTDGYDRTKTPKRIKVRRMTVDEIKALGSHCEFIANDGKLRRVKINGKVRTWKRHPERVEVPLKYGMRDYATFGPEDFWRLVVRVEE